MKRYNPSWLNLPSLRAVSVWLSYRRCSRATRWKCRWVSTAQTKSKAKSGDPKKKEKKLGKITKVTVGSDHSHALPALSLSLERHARLLRSRPLPADIKRAFDYIFEPPGAPTGTSSEPHPNPCAFSTRANFYLPRSTTDLTDRKPPSKPFLLFVCPIPNCLLIRRQLTTGAVYEGVFHTGCPTDAKVRSHQLLQDIALPSLWRRHGHPPLRHGSLSQSLSRARVCGCASRRTSIPSHCVVIAKTHFFFGIPGNGFLDFPDVIYLVGLKEKKKTRCRHHIIPSIIFLSFRPTPDPRVPSPPSFPLADVEREPSSSLARL